MINALLKGIMSLVQGLVTVVLAPIDLIIEQFLPDLSSAIGAIGGLFEYCLGSVFGFVVDSTCLSTETLSLIVLFYTFKLTAPILVSAAKSSIRWYNAIKP